MLLLTPVLVSIGRWMSKFSGTLLAAALCMAPEPVAAATGISMPATGASVVLGE